MMTISAPLAYGEVGYGRANTGKNALSPSMQAALTKQMALENQAREEEEEAAQMSREEIREKQLARIKERCASELAKPPVAWRFISLDDVRNNSSRTAPGMMYGLEFPFTEQMLLKMGPKWLTTAFHAAGSIPPDVKVMKVISEKKTKITAGNNAAKFLFEVVYDKKRPDLHTQFFAKIPYPLEGATSVDRLSSSVYKQPMDLCELNTYRLYEGALPFESPQFYYGDINNDTSNFILITARIPFAELGLKRDPYTKQIPKPLNPYEVEGPYDKCKDYQLRRPAGEYYLLLMKQKGKVAGVEKAGNFGDERLLASSLMPLPGDVTKPETWGVNPTKASGVDPRQFSAQINTGIKFVSDTAKQIYPQYATSDEFIAKFRKVFSIINGYQAEIQFWKHKDIDYVGLGHNNLNMDNAYFWTDDNGDLDCGVIDYGGYGMSCLGHKIWWCINCADYSMIESHLADLEQMFITSYEEYGGPKIDPELLHKHVMLTALQNTLQMIGALPNSLKMCPAKEFATIKDRHDPRIASDVDGKSTLRTTLHVLNNGVRLIEEMGADVILEKWVEEFWEGEMRMTAKTNEMLGL